jgi:small subunit ribosomal protein S1
MPTDYDEKGNYRYPEGFDPESGEWRDGFDEARAKWEKDYAAARTRWEAHKVQVARMNAEAEKFPELPEANSVPEAAVEDSEKAGTRAEDEQLAQLREQLSGEEA